MKSISIFFISIALLFASCAQDSDQSSTDENSNSNSSTTNAPIPVTDPNLNGQQPVNSGNPALVAPTLPNNVRQAQQQNEQNQQLNIQPLNQQQQQQQVAAPVPVKTIGDERTAHFICSNACKGSGADAVSNCPVCGSTYTHNADSPWHAANQVQTPQTSAQPGQPTPASVQPIQNANPLPAGDHNTSHYICPDRCVGGGNLSPGKCPVCSKDYVHNAESEAHKEEIRRRGP